MTDLTHGEGDDSLHVTHMHIFVHPGVCQFAHNNVCQYLGENFGFLTFLIPATFNCECTQTDTPLGRGGSLFWIDCSVVESFS